MFREKLMMYIYAETPIHPGSGTAISGAVDLPIQRERHTEFPTIHGSSLKGVLRNSACTLEIDDGCKRCSKKLKDVEECKILKKTFGGPEGIGGISVTDARILAFPVRTLRGVFGWVTCPLALHRYRRDLELAGIKVSWSIPEPASDEEAKVCEKSNLIEEYVYIEDLQLKYTKDKNVSKIAEEMIKGLSSSEAYTKIKEKLRKDLVIVSDNVFRDLVALTTEIVTRIRIEPETGTVETGGLWSEEYLPTDTIMYSLIPILIGSDDLKTEDIKRHLKKYDEQILQIGGDETVGKGFARIKLIEEGGKDVKKS